MTTPTPRTDELKRAIWQLMQAQESEKVYAWRDAIHCGIEQLERDLAAAQEALRFVERWANHHGVKPTCSAEAALSTIQHYPPILAITRSYADGKVPETRNPWAELSAAQEARDIAVADAIFAKAAIESGEKLLKEAQEARQAAEARAAQNAKLLREIVDAWDNGKEDDSIIASRRVTDAFIKARAAIAGEKP